MELQGLQRSSKEPDRPHGGSNGGGGVCRAHTGLMELKAKGRPRLWGWYGIRLENMLLSWPLLLSLAQWEERTRGLALAAAHLVRGGAESMMVIPSASELLGWQTLRAERCAEPGALVDPALGHTAHP